MIEDLPHLFIQFLRRLVQLNRERHVRLARTVFPHVLRLFVEASVNGVVFVPGDETAGTGVFGVHQPVANTGHILLT